MKSLDCTSFVAKMMANEPVALDRLGLLRKD
jgi:hypothetical protein